MIDIGDVARATGLTVATLRYYEKRGLIESVDRVGLRRQFDNSVLERLALIALGRRAGFSLDEITTVFLVNGGTAIDRDRLRSKANEIDATIAELSAVRDNLRHAADCPETNHLACPSFKRLLASASPGRGSGSSDPQSVRSQSRSW